MCLSMYTAAFMSRPENCSERSCRCCKSKNERWGLSPLRRLMRGLSSGDKPTARCLNDSSMLQRILEPEVMDSPQEALEYDTMDHSAVNRVFVDDLLAARPAPGDVLDLGTGTALIPIELCKRETTCRIM